MAGHLTVEQVKSIEDLSSDLIAEWEDILYSNHSEIPFSDPDWLKLWWKHFSSGCRQLIITVRFDDKLIGVIPFVERKKLFHRQISFMGCPQATNMDLAVRPEFLNEVLGAVSSCLENLSGPVLYHFPGLNESSAMTELFARQFKRINHSFLESKTICPVIYTEGQDYHDYYRQRIRRHQKNNDKRCFKRLALLGQVDFHELTEADMAKVFEIHKSRWKKKLDTSEFTKQESQEFYSDLLVCKSDRWRVLTLGIYLDNELISFEYGYVCGGQALLNRSSYNSLFGVYALGKMTHREIFRQCFERGLHTINLGIGYEEHKIEWTDQYEVIKSFDFNKGDLLSRLLFKFVFIKGSIRNRLKQNRKIVLFKRNTLGRMKYFFTAENLEYVCITFFARLKRQGFTGYLQSFCKKRRYKIYRLNLMKYTVLTDTEPCRTRKASVNDVQEIGFFINCDPEFVIKRFYKLEQCYVFERDHAVICLAWVAAERDKSRIYDCRQYRRRCREQDVFRMFIDIIACLQKQGCGEAALELEAGNKIAERAARRAGFQPFGVETQRGSICGKS